MRRQQCQDCLRQTNGHPTKEELLSLALLMEKHFRQQPDYRRGVMPSPYAIGRPWLQRDRGATGRTEAQQRKSTAERQASLNDPLPPVPSHRLTDVDIWRKRG